MTFEYFWLNLLIKYSARGGISSFLYLKGGSSITITANLKKRSSLKYLFFSSGVGLLLAAITLTSISVPFVSPMGRTI